MIPKSRTPVYDMGSYVATLESFCFLQAIYDLLSGRLHRLDPVIGDQGCQWRVPFVLDVQEALLEIIDQKLGIGILTRALQGYELTTANLLNNRKYARFLNFHIYCQKFSSKMQNNKTKLKGGALKAATLKFYEKNDTCLQKLIADIETGAPEFSQVLTCASDFLEVWKADIFTTSAKEYLICNKLISLRRIRRIDCFGLSSVPLDIELPIEDPYRIKKYKSLACSSYEYMKHVSEMVCNNSGNTVQWIDKGNDIWEAEYLGNPDNIDVSIHKSLQYNYSTLQAKATYDTHLFFGPLRLIFMYQAIKLQPIIIDHRRIKCTSLNSSFTYTGPKGEIETFDDAVYEYLGGSILYFEPTGNGTFVFVPNPTSDQQRKVGMCVESYSIITEGDITDYGQDNGFKSENFNDYLTALTTAPIVNLIMMAASIHPELPMNSTVNTVRTSDTRITSAEGNRVYALCTPVQYLPQNHSTCLINLSGPSVPLNSVSTDVWNVVCEKQRCLGLLARLNVTDTEYRHVLPGRVAGRRIINTIPFGAIHIYGCTYAVKVAELNIFLNDPTATQVRNQGVRRLMDPNLDTNRPY